MEDNGLTTSQTERLALFIEECGEAIQIAGKILRHGFNCCDPTAAPPNLNNRGMLMKEIGDVLAAIELLSADIDVRKVHENAHDKIVRAQRWLHFQPTSLLTTVIRELNMRAQYEVRKR